MARKRKSAKRFEGIIRGKFIFDGCTSISQMIDSLLDEMNSLKKMKDSGIELCEEVTDDHAFLVTNDPEVAAEFGFSEALEGAE